MTRASDRLAKGVSPGPLLDLFCGIGGLSAGFRNAGWLPVAGVDRDGDLARAYGLNFPGSEAIEGDVSDPGLRERLVADYGPGGRKLPRGSRRLSAVVGGPPCVGLSDANRGRSVSNPVNELPFAFVRLAAALGTDLIVMEQSKNLKLLKSPSTTRESAGESLADRLLRLLELLGYDASAEILGAEDYGVPQKRRRTIVVAFRRPSGRGGASRSLRGDAVFPPPTTTEGRPVPAGRVLKPPFSGAILEGPDLAKVKARDAMTKKEIGAMGWFPRRAYTTMDLSEPSPTLRTFVHTAAGAFTLRDEARGTYHRMGVREMLALQTFPRGFRVPDRVTKARVGVGNAVPVKLAEAIARGIVDRGARRDTRPKIR